MPRFVLASRADSIFRERSPVMARSLVEPSRDLRPAAVRQPAPGFLSTVLSGDGRIEALDRYGTLAARLLISQIFLLSGLMKVLDPAGTADQMASRGMFWIPFFLWSA